MKKPNIKDYTNDTNTIYYDQFVKDQNKYVTKLERRISAQNNEIKSKVETISEYAKQNAELLDALKSIQRWYEAGETEKTFVKNKMYKAIKKAEG